MSNTTNQNSTIECPKCQTKIEITKAMTEQVEGRIRQQLEAETAAQKAVLDKQAQTLAMQKAAVDKTAAELTRAKAEMDQKVKDAIADGVREGVTTGVAAQRAAIAAQARKEAEADSALELEEKAARVSELEGKLKESKQTELAMMKRERELKEKADSLELDVARRVKEEMQGIRDAARKEAADEHLLKDTENREQNAALRRQVEDLRQKLSQGSQQLQGEALELILEDVLGRAFPLDGIDPIRKGVNGADILQRVQEPSGLECGSILWETKNAKKWTPAWLTKLRDDQREAKAAIAVIVAEAMPPNSVNPTQIEGVWVCSRATAEGLGMALRAGLVDLAKSRQASDGLQGKAERAYEFVTSTEFRQRISGMVDPLVNLRKSLDKERTAMERIWKTREEEITAVVRGLSGLYGTFQGIAGSTLPTLPALDLPQLGESSGDAANG